jgi:hypothetical protein
VDCPQDGHLGDSHAVWTVYVHWHVIVTKPGQCKLLPQPRHGDVRPFCSSALTK